MRPALYALPLILTLAPTAAFGQDTDPKDNVSSLRQKFQYTKDGYYARAKQLKQDAAQQNAQVDQLYYDKEVYMAKRQIYDNVISLRRRDALDKFIDEGRAKLNATELTGYARLGKYNPFDNSSYIRYYDKDGNLIAYEVRNSYQELIQAQRDWEQAAARARERDTQISDSYQKVLNSYRRARDAKRDLDEALTKDRTEKKPSESAPKGSSVAGTRWKHSSRRNVEIRFLKDGTFGYYYNRKMYLKGSWKEKDGIISLDYTSLEDGRSFQNQAKVDGKKLNWTQDAWELIEE